MRPGSIESKRPTEPVPRVRQTVPPPHPPSLCIATRSAPLRVARLSYPPIPPAPRAPYRRTSPHFAQWINQAEWWGTRHRVYVYVYIPMSDEARRNSVASIYYNKRDVKRGGQTRWRPVISLYWELHESRMRIEYQSLTLGMTRHDFDLFDKR